MKDNYQKNVWPWNTARVVDHLNEIIYDTARENIDVVIRANPITGKYGSIDNLEDAAQFCQDLVDATDSPIVFRKTFFNTVYINVIINLIFSMIEIELTKDVVDRETVTGFKVKYKRLL